jgi:hypothetical protein
VHHMFFFSLFAGCAREPALFSSIVKGSGTSNLMIDVDDNCLTHSLGPYDVNQPLYESPLRGLEDPFAGSLWSSLRRVLARIHVMSFSRE